MHFLCKCLLHKTETTWGQGLRVSYFVTLPHSSHSQRSHKLVPCLLSVKSILGDTELIISPFYHKLEIFLFCYLASGTLVTIQKYFVFCEFSKCKLSFQCPQWAWGLAWVTVESPASQLECGWIGGRLKDARNKVTRECMGGWGVFGSALWLAEVIRFDLNWVS